MTKRKREIARIDDKEYHRTALCRSTGGSRAARTEFCSFVFCGSVVLLPISALHRPVNIALCLALSDIVALVVELLAFGQPKLKLCQPTLQVDSERGQACSPGAQSGRRSG